MNFLAYDKKPGKAADRNRDHFVSLIPKEVSHPVWGILTDEEDLHNLCKRSMEKIE